MWRIAKGQEPMMSIPRYRKAMGYKSTSTPRLVRDANQHASDIAHSVLHTSRNPPSWLANNTQLRWPSMRELVPRYSYRKYLHGVGHDAGTLVSTHASEDWVSIAGKK